MRVYTVRESPHQVDLILELRKARSRVESWCKKPLKTSYKGILILDLYHAGTLPCWGQQQSAKLMKQLFSVLLYSDAKRDLSAPDKEL